VKYLFPYPGKPVCLWLVIILLAGSLSCSYAYGFFQAREKVTVSGDNISLREIFSIIQKQTGYHFFYSGEHLDSKERTSIHVKDAPLESVLQLLFKGRGLEWAYSENVILIRKIRTDKILAEGRDSLLTMITGKVTDAAGAPLVGATVLVKGTGRGEVTNEHGRFFFRDVNAGAILLVSFAGYDTRQVKVNTQAEISVQLERGIIDIAGVSVVSTGYQALPRERATGSFVKVGNDLLNRKVSTGILDRLEGVSSGVLFDRRNPANPQIQIRGLYTLTSTIAQPLIVVDNFPYEGDINNFNPNDVESITILKDAAAASIWGAKAGNGVIVITTKKGSYNQRPSISLNSNITILDKPNLFSLPQIPASDYIDLERFLFDHGFYNGAINRRRPPLTPVVELLLKQRNGQISAAEADAAINALRNVDVRNDFERYIYRKGVNQQYAASISGGGNNVKYFFSTGFDRNLSTLKGNDYRRITIRSDNTIQPVKGLQLQAGLQYTQGNETSNSPGGYGSANYRMQTRALPPYARLADENGNPLPIDKYRAGFTDTAGQGLLLDWKYRPLEELGLNDDTRNARLLLANFGVKYDVFRSLSAEVKYQYQRADETNRTYYDERTFFTRDLINRFTQIVNGSPVYIVPRGGILDVATTNQEGHMVRGQLNFDHTWRTKHEVAAIGGAELRQLRTVGNSNRLYGSDNAAGFANVDYVGVYPVITGGMENIPTGFDLSGRLDRFVSLYLNAAYTFDERYTVSASARKDASNLFGVETNRKGVPLWSSGVGWKISNEQFYHASLFPYLNLRVTYGASGNVNNSIYALTAISRSPAAFQSTNIPFATIANIANPNLRWEKVNTLNIGIDFAMRNNRLTGSVEFYRKQSTDVIGLEPLDLTTGLGAMQTNSADIKGKGIEVQLTSHNLTGRDFKWQTSAILNYTDYKVGRFLLAPQTDGFVNDGGTIIPLPGYNPYLVVSYKFAGLDPATGDPQGYVDGHLSKDYNALVQRPISEQVIHGPALPPVFGNILNTFSWKGISLSANITYKLGYYFRRSTISYVSLYSSGTGHSDYLKRWRQPGDEQHTNVPSMIYPNPTSLRDLFYTNSDITVEKGDHIRLEDVRLSYRFRNFQVYAYTSNLNALIWKANKAGLDPDAPSGLRPPRTIALGVKMDIN
jgi:TonB-linked SusC/RagA family outer membrane protein